MKRNLTLLLGAALVIVLATLIWPAPTVRFSEVNWKAQKDHCVVSFNIANNKSDTIVAKVKVRFPPVDIIDSDLDIPNSITVPVFDYAISLNPYETKQFKTEIASPCDRNAVEVVSG